ncbi:MAG: hypothetical protein HY903_03895 [Deltaproteobacteria bacterium]|nr:hypothetical protein [Deltaproteobacteria bacterium]
MNRQHLVLGVALATAAAACRSDETDPRPPTVSLSLGAVDVAGSPTTAALPLNPATGMLVVDSESPCAVVITATPSPDTHDPVRLLHEGSGDPSTLAVYSDVPVRDPLAEVIYNRGVNIAPAFHARPGSAGDGAEVIAVLVAVPQDALTALATFTARVADAAGLGSEVEETTVELATPFPPEARGTLQAAPTPGAGALTGVLLPQRLVGGHSVLTSPATPFALTVEVLPNPQSGLKLDLVDEATGRGDPATLLVTVDVALGDPRQGGVDAGENLAQRFNADVAPLVDPVTGATTVAFVAAAGLVPPPGTATFTVRVVDVGGHRSLTTRVALDVSAGASFSRDVQPIFTGLCAQCHFSPYGMSPSLAQGTSYAQIVGVFGQQVAMPIVQPFTPSRSYLLHKIAGTFEDVGGGGVRMPRYLPPLNGVELETIEDWILLGAPND